MLGTYIMSYMTLYIYSIFSLSIFILLFNIYNIYKNSFWESRFVPLEEIYIYPYYILTIILTLINILDLII